MDSHLGFVELQSVYYYLPKRSHLGNHTYPQTSHCHHSRSDQEVGRDSLGSDCSAPGMVEDHGSDVSIEDDYQYPGTQAWESFWTMRMSNRASRGPRYPALIDFPATTHKPTQDQEDVIMEEQGMLGESRRGDSEQSVSSGSSPSSTPKRHRPRTPKPPPRASYTIFPPACPAVLPSAMASLSRPRAGSGMPLQQSSSSSLNTPRASVDRNTPSPTSSMVSRDPTPLPHAISQPGKVAPTIRAVPPTPTPGSPVIPFPSFSTEALIRASYQKPLPEPPIEARTTSRRPSLANFRKLSLSKLSTNSSPSLAQLAKTQSQPQPQPQAQLQVRKLLRPSAEVITFRHPLWESTLPPPSPSPSRPLPPLPQSLPRAQAQTQQPSISSPDPPNFSFFDFDDSDAESTSDAPPRRLARKLMRGLANHNLNFQLRRDREKDKNKDKAKETVNDKANEKMNGIVFNLNHTRSASESPSPSSAQGYATQGYIHGKRPRADTLAEWPSGQGGYRGRNLSVDVVREEDEGNEKEGEGEFWVGSGRRRGSKEGRPWLTRQSSEIFGRILGRRSA